MEFTEEHAKSLQDTHDAVIRIETTLLGQNGHPGVVDKLVTICDEHEKLKGQFKLLVGILIGSGVLSGTVVGILQALF